MPTYTYSCKNCGRTQDEFHAISAKPRIKCLVCGGSCRKMLGTGSGIIFKGSGFYETDYKSKKSGSTSSADSKSDANSGAGKSSDSQSDGKASAKPAKTASPSE